MSEYLFLFSITPVQAFIEQARKTQDLYAGSQILSHLCRAAIEASKLTPGQIIFPNYDPKSIGSGYCLPNRFLARFEANGETLKQLGEDVKDAVKKTFHEMATIVIEKHTGRKKLSPEEERQIETYLTINWVFVPVNGDYKTAYKNIERSLGAIKQVRTFDQLEQAPGRKCAICGERNVKFYRKTEKESEDKQPRIPKKLFLTNESEATIWKYHECSPKLLQDGEGLCAVCYAKRAAEEYNQLSNFDSDFPSTGEIALFDAIRQLKKPLRNWIEASYDPQVVFDLAQHRHQKAEDLKTSLKSSKSRYTEKMLNDIKNAESLWEELQRDEIKVSSYYALLRFDGDSMGNWLSGSKLAPGSDPFEFHKALSARLKAFAEHARTLVRPFEGKIVYVGGDDFLGFVTLKSMFAVLRRLREAFRAEVHEKLFAGEKQFELEDATSELTFSAGVVVAHYKTPLSEALKWTHTTEKAAKEANAEKDRFALAVLRHSGEIHHTLFKWKEGDVWMPRIFHRIVTRIRKEVFSTTFLDHLEREFRPLLDQLGEMSYNELLQAEIKRLIEKSCLLAKRPNESRERFEKRKSAAIRAMSGDLLKLLASKSPKRWGENVFSALGIIDFFTRKAAQL